MNRFVYILGFLLLLIFPASSQSPQLFRQCVGTAPNCIPISVAAPLPVTGSFAPSGTQDINLKQIQGAVPSLANPLWVFPATGATFPVSGTFFQATQPVSNAGTFAVQAAQSGTWTVQPGNTANTTPWLVTSTPSSAAGVGLTPVSTAALASNSVTKASAGNLYSFEVSADVTLSAAPWWIMIFDATSLPSNGAVTPKKCYAMAGGVTSYSAAFPTPAAFGAGITIGVSTTGCFSLTASVHAFISGDAQ